MNKYCRPYIVIWVQDTRGVIFVRHAKELTRITEINTNSKEFDWTILVLISVTRVSSLKYPTKIPPQSLFILWERRAVAKSLLTVHTLFVCVYREASDSSVYPSLSYYSACQWELATPAFLLTGRWWWPKGMGQLPYLNKETNPWWYIPWQHTYMGTISVWCVCMDWPLDSGLSFLFFFYKPISVQYTKHIGCRYM